MNAIELADAVRRHAGTFRCEKIHDGTVTKTVDFAHVVEPPGEVGELPAIGRLPEFYATVGGITFYRDARSGDAARVLAPPSDWAELQEAFRGWWEDMDEDELEEYAPAWFTTCLVIGETPHSGNYILMPTVGAEAGQVHEFDHDGFEVVHRGDDIVDYAARLLQPDAERLTDFASHLRFIEPDSSVQWWIKEMRDNRGHVGRTRD